MHAFPGKCGLHPPRPNVLCDASAGAATAEFMRFLDKDKGIALPDVLHSIANAGAAIRKENEALKKRLQDFRDGFRRLTSSCAGELKRQWERMDLLLRDNIQVNQVRKAAGPGPFPSRWFNLSPPLCGVCSLLACCSPLKRPP